MFFIFMVGFPFIYGATDTDRPALKRSIEELTAFSGPYKIDALDIILNNFRHFKRINAVEIEQLKEKGFFSKARQNIKHSEITPIIHKILYRDIAQDPDCITECYQNDRTTLIEDYNDFVLYLQKHPHRHLEEYLYGLQKIMEWDMAHPLIKIRKDKSRKIWEEDKEA